MEFETLEDLYIHKLKDLYSAEKQLIKALSRMARAATNDDLIATFEDHVEQTKEHARRLENILHSRDESTWGLRCKGMESLLKEGAEVLKEEADDDVRDAGLISSAQRVEHYEIACYGCACTYAEMLGDEKGAELLDTTLEEEDEIDKKLTRLARSVINVPIVGR